MASIHKRPGRPKNDPRYDAHYRTPEGKQRSKTFRRKVDAETFAANIETDIDRGQWVDPRLSRTSFGAWAEHVEATRVNRRPTTRERDARLMRTRVRPAFDEAPLGGIDRLAIREWIASLTASGLAPATVRKCYQLASRVFDEAVEANLIASSPCQRVELPAAHRPEPALLTPEHVEALSEVIDPRYRALVLTSAYTGLRWGELAGLRVDRVDFLRRRADVVEILVETDAGLTFGPPKTKASRALVSFPTFLADELGRHVGAYPDSDQDRRLLFTTADGSPLRRSNFRRRVWQPAARAAELPKGATFHHLRHATASWLIHSGANPLEVAQRLRHTRVTTTLATYGHLFPGTDDRLDDLLEQTRSGATSGRQFDPRSTAL